MPLVLYLNIKDHPNRTMRFEFGKLFKNGKNFKFDANIIIVFPVRTSLWNILTNANKQSNNRKCKCQADARVAKQNQGPMRVSMSQQV